MPCQASRNIASGRGSVSSNATRTLANRWGVEPDQLKAIIERRILEIQVPDRNLLIFRLLWGLLDGRDHTMAELSRRFRVTRTRVRQIELAVLDKLVGKYLVYDNIRRSFYMRIR
jgi:DNA-directed RNA polymerase sigma subunit (sigma70/sigma32)